MATKLVHSTKLEKEDRRREVRALTRAIEKEARALGVSIDDLCAAFGISRQCWRFWRDGERTPHQLTIDGLRSHAGRLHIVVEWLDAQLAGGGAIR